MSLYLNGNIQTSENLEKENKESQEEIPGKNEGDKENKKDTKDSEEMSSDNAFKSKFYKEEVVPLLKTKKERLQNKFKKLYNKFDELGDIKIYDIIKNNSKEDNENSLTGGVIEIAQEDLKKIKEKKRKYIEKRKYKIYIFAFFFLLFYLIGIFQLLDLFDSTKKVTGIIFKSFFFNELKENKELFKDLYINSCFKNIPEFDFAFVTSFLGSFPLNLFGFFWSSLLFTILNSFLYVNFMKLDFEKEKFDFFDFFHVSIYFLLFFISFGAISLFPHEKISEGIVYYEKQKKLYTEQKDNKKDKEEKKGNNENNEDQKEKVIHIDIREQEKKVKEDKFEPKYEMNYPLFIIISLGIIFAYIINKTANYSFYQKASKFFNKHFELVFLIIYVGSYVLSLIFYFLFHYQIIVVKEIENYEEEYEEEIKSAYYRICGFLIYYEKVPIDNRKESEINEEKQKKEEEINIKNNSIFKRFYCASCKLGCRKFYNYSDERNFGIISCCTCCLCNNWCCEGCKSCCCDCCSELELKESYEEEEIFCYVYQTQRKCSWFCDICFQNNIISLIIHNISIELGIIGFEKKLNENLESRTIQENVKTIGAYLGNFFIFIFIFIIGYTLCGFSSLENKTFTFYSVFLYIFYAYDITISGFSLFAKDKLESITNDWLILLPLSYTKYINFLVLDKLVSILDDENIDILSNSLIMTSVFFVYDIIVFLIADFLDCSSDVLIFLQFIIGFIIIFPAIVGEIISKIKTKK